MIRFQYEFSKIKIILHMNKKKKCMYQKAAKTGKKILCWTVSSGAEKLKTKN